MGSIPSGPCPKESPLCPTTTTSVALREEEVTSEEVHLPMGSSEAITGPLRSSQLPVALQGPPICCHIPQLTLFARSFKQVNVKGSCRIYICEWCGKQTFNWDFMVSHCLQEHLRICLVCPHCGMSYSDPLKFHLHGRGIHNLLFY